MNMKWITDDGKEFDDLDAAKAHEAKLAKETSLRVWCDQQDKFAPGLLWQVAAVLLEDERKAERFMSLFNAALYG